jgi:hypothetical protein
MADMGVSGDLEPGEDFDPDEDFYEDDEPVEAVQAAYEHGIRGVTARPAMLKLSGPDFYLPAPHSKSSPVSVSYSAAAPEPIRVAAAAEG